MSSELFLGQLYECLDELKNNPQPDSYTSTLFASENWPEIAKKLGEEGVELGLEFLLLKLGQGESERLVSETADLLYRLLCLLVAAEVPLESVWEELASRRK